MKTAHDLVLQAKQSVQEISVQQAVFAIQTCDVLIDVREADEYAVELSQSVGHAFHIAFA